MISIRHPALKRRAIVECPFGTKRGRQDGYLYCRNGVKSWKHPVEPPGGKLSLLASFPLNTTNKFLAQNGGYSSRIHVPFSPIPFLVGNICSRRWQRIKKFGSEGGSFNIRKSQSLLLDLSKFHRNKDTDFGWDLNPATRS